MVLLLTALQQYAKVWRPVVAITAVILVGWCVGGISAAAPSSGTPTWGQILIVGGEKQGIRRLPFVAELYDPVSNRFTARRPVMHQERLGAAATVIPLGPNTGKVLVAGGYDEKFGLLASTEIYDPDSDTFSHAPTMNDTRDTFTATVITVGAKRGWILLAEGNSTDLYDPFANIFAHGPELEHSRISNTATLISAGPNTGKVLFAGGADDPVTATELYDPATNAFIAGPAMNANREAHTATVIAAGPDAGKILLAGGRAENRKGEIVSLSSTELYDPATNTFAPPGATATMQFARAFHTATVIPSGPNAGKILIAGGQDDRADQPNSMEVCALSSTEIYDPATNRFVPGPPMRWRRTEQGAIAIASGPNAGKILIIGGVGSASHNLSDCRTASLASTELYDPATNSFAPGPLMHGAPGDVVALQLPSSPSPRLGNGVKSPAPSLKQ